MTSYNNNLEIYFILIRVAYNLYMVNFAYFFTFSFFKETSINECFHNFIGC